MTHTSRRRPARRAAELIVIVAAFAPTLLADAPLSTAEAPCSTRRATTLGQIACELVRGLPSSSEGSEVAVRPLETKLRVQRPDELVLRLARLVAGELGPGSSADARVMNAGRAFEASTRGRRVILSAEFKPGGLSVSADVLGPAPRFWERMRGLTSATVAHSFASRPLDAELRGHLPALPLVLSGVDKLLGPDEPVLALACGDADGDGNLELLALGRLRIQLGRLLRGRFTPLRSKSWSELGEVAPSPWREPLGSASFTAPASLEVGSTDRDAAFRLDENLVVVARFPTQIPWPGGGCARIADSGLGPRQTCSALPTTALRSPELGFDALAGARLLQPSAEVLEVFAGRLKGQSSIQLLVGAKRVQLGQVVGAQMAVGDLNGDGRPELVTTRDTLSPDVDSLLVHSLGSGNALREIYRVEAPAGVRAVCFCPSEDSGLGRIVAAVGNELWVLR